jgi:hypothetical protein
MAAGARPCASVAGVGAAAARRGGVQGFPSRGHGGWSGGERAQGALEGLGQTQPGFRLKLATVSRRRYGGSRLDAMGGGERVAWAGLVRL